MGGDSALFVTDDEGRYLAANDGALTLLGYSREELAAINVRDVSVSSDEEIAEVQAMLKRDHSVQHARTFDGRTVSSARSTTSVSSRGSAVCRSSCRSRRRSARSSR